MTQVYGLSDKHAIRFMYHDVTDFHVKFQLPLSASKAHLPEGEWNFRLLCVMEESKELKDAVDAVDILDALVDLAYFSLGTIYVCGCTQFDLDPFRYQFTLDELKAFYLYEQNFNTLVESNPFFFLDVAYACRYHARQFNWDFDRAWSLVHAANMTKVRAKSPEDSKRGSRFDVIKPDGWIVPNLEDCV